MTYVLPATFETYINQAYQQVRNRLFRVKFPAYFGSNTENRPSFQVFATYDWAKHSNAYMESTLDSVEQRVTDAAQAVNQRATDTYVNYYINPKTAVANAYFTGIEKGRSAAVQTGTLALAVAVLTGQKGLQLTAGGATFLLNGMMVTKEKGSHGLKMIRDVVEEKIRAGIQEIERIAKVG